MTKVNNLYFGIKNRKNAPHCSECGAIFFPCEEIFTWESGKTCMLLCADCFDSQVNGLSRFELAELIGSEVYICGQ